MPDTTKPPRQYNPAQWTLELHLGSDVFHKSMPDETQARRAMAEALRRPPGSFDRLRLWHRHTLIATAAPGPSAPRPLPPPCSDGIRRLPPASRAIRQFQAHNSPEALGL